MSETYQLGLPLVQPAQAQKHVTVNEALSRLDVLVQLRVVSSGLNEPPLSPFDGEAYIVALGGNGVWASREGQIASYSNGGWVFTQPRTGWRCWDEARKSWLVFEGVAWQESVTVISPSSALVFEEFLEFDHILQPGAVSITGDIIPAGSVLMGASARVLADITGAGTSSWQMGVLSDASLLGGGYGVLAGTTVARPLASGHFLDTASAIVLTPDGTDFAAGVVRLSLHIRRMRAAAA